MENLFITLIIAFALFIVYQVINKSIKARREKLIDSFQFPASITDKVMEKYPHLSQSEANLVLKGLREYFHVCNIAGKRMVSMPSQAVDVAWHEFILFTKQYSQFCNKALGRFLHHTPAEAMRSPTDAQTGIKTAWRVSCCREGILPKSAHRLPLLFAMDAKLAIPDGFKYSLNCNGRNSNAYCAAHIGCGGGFGGGGCGGDSSGCSSGCGGGGD